MKIKLIALGQKMPSWVEAGFNEYKKRLQSDIDFQLCECPIAKRTKTGNITTWLNQEGQIILRELSDSDYMVVLDAQGKLHSTESLAQRLEHWKLLGQRIAIIIGGPDGIEQSIKSKANESISLSKMTFPHPLVRIMITEQIYRAMCILKGHPYHK
ncbi:23S rRNA (pseudouridine(1915)-N(3))-methyltransferase RlmH [Thiotrichales bacterium 19S3-7]|nr:23S rRNA (pseudouridine(1915)-N(3))-methyltransferase RlmH [Thiotrichales bacterium 19S3-7]MCF6802429.1 23S rRNA (pseudouridine(1915)-N(3))-methyltransferase RlmH [Thiotrichales bacterium 19S3-11]